MKLTEAVVAFLVYFNCVDCTSLEGEPQSLELECYVGTPSKLDLIKCIAVKEEPQHEVKTSIISSEGGRQRRRRYSDEKNVSLSSLPSLNTTLIYEEQEDTNIIVSDEGRRQQQAISCLVFVPLVLNTSKNANESTTHFDCDSNRICEENYKYENNRRENVTFQGQLGDLFCCRGSKCNERHSAFPTRFAPYSDKPLCCSAGPNVKETILCPIETTDCFNRTVFVENSTLEEYGCDLAQHCTGRSGNPNGECSTFVDEHGRPMELCCCATNDCNSPPLTQSLLGFGVFGRMKWEMYGWMAVTMITMSVAAIVLAVRRRRNRMYSDISVISDPRYQRLTANFSAGDTDDVKMLLAD